MVSGKAPTATLTGLSLTASGVYVCAVDADGAKVSPLGVQGVRGTLLSGSWQLPKAVE